MELVLNNGMVELSKKDMYNITGGYEAWVYAFAMFLFATTAAWALEKALDAGYEYAMERMFGGPGSNGGGVGSW